MIPSFTLERSLPITICRVFANIEVEEKRPELMPFLTKAKFDGQVTAATAARDLLGSEQARKPVAVRLLNSLARSGALEIDPNAKDAYVLTKLGHQALERNRIFVEEADTWEIRYVDDPLIPDCLISIESVRDVPSAFEEAGRDAPKRRLIDTDRVLLGLQKQPITPVANSHRRRIAELPKTVEKRDPQQATLRWDVGARQLSLTIGETQYDLPPPDRSHEEVFLDLLDTNGLRANWDRDRSVLLRDSLDVPDCAKRSMAEDIAVPADAGRMNSALNIPGLGLFRSTTVQQVPITASTETHAGAWARWRQRDAINAVAHKARFDEWTCTARAPFAEFEPLSLPERHILARSAMRRHSDTDTDTAFRNLIAAEDWNL